MNANLQNSSIENDVLPTYEAILLAVDSSDHSNRGITEAVALAQHHQSTLTATHVYAAKLHDLRFRQMEGGLPEQFREENELERQREVHDTLISKGLSIITDSYFDQVAEAAENAGQTLQRRSLEGKNYREVVREANRGTYDLLIMGALGLGAVNGSRLGTVCQRVTRRSAIDTLIIKNPEQSISDGPIVVGVDGSEKSYGGLLSALSLAKLWDVEVKVVSAFDPYYHYVAFNRIAGVLSEEAGQVFKFQEQEQLHEEIIDSGLAKIYQGHLEVAKSIGRDFGVELETVLLDGKPHEVINRYLEQINPSLLVLGTTGIHADADLDIGGNTEYLLSDARCSVLLSQRTHKPEIDRLASVSTSWTREAEERMTRVPSFVRSMAKMAILRYAQDRGHTVITESIVEEATAQLMPGYAEKAMGELVDAYDNGDLKKKPAGLEVIRWSDTATKALLSVTDLSLRGNLSMRAEKKARAAGSLVVEVEHILAFIEAQSQSETKEESKPILEWQASALARLMRVPQGFMRDKSKQRIEDYAIVEGLSSITMQVAEAGLADARNQMSAEMGVKEKVEVAEGKCPFAAMMKAGAPTEENSTDKSSPQWSDEARTMLDSVPPGFCRDMTSKAAESIAEQNGVQTIDPEFVDSVMQTFKAGSDAAEESMPWCEAARIRIARAPDMVKGMLVKEIEGWSQREGITEVNEQAVDAIKAVWASRGVFHLDPDDPRNG